MPKPSQPPRQAHLNNVQQQLEGLAHAPHGVAPAGQEAQLINARHRTDWLLRVVRG